MRDSDDPQSTPFSIPTESSSIKCNRNNHPELYSGYGKETSICYCCSSPRRQPLSLLASLGICILVLLYTLIGALTFMSLEGEQVDQNKISFSQIEPELDNKVVKNIRGDVVSKLWSITEDLNILYKENWTNLAIKEVLIFQKELVKLLKHSGSNVLLPNGTITVFEHGFHEWNFCSSFLYSLTLITTIGYGSITPRTLWGKLFTILYAVIGIPLMLLYLFNTGDGLARGFRKLYGRICISRQRQSRCVCSNGISVPVMLCLLIILTYIGSGSLMFHILENWSFLEGSYFCFTSLGTIGFGDSLVERHVKDISLCICSAYILLGMALSAMCFSLLRSKVKMLFRYIEVAHIADKNSTDKTSASILAST